MPNTLRDFNRGRSARDWTIIEGGASGTKEQAVIVDALIRSAALEEVLRAALGEDVRKVLRVRRAPGLDAATLNRLQADAIIVEIDAADRRELDLIGEFVAGAGSPPLIVTAPGLDVASTCDLVHRGVRHILVQPVKSAELDAVLKLALAHGDRRQTAPPRRSGLVVSLLGSGGGVGTTTLAVQGACALSHLKRFKRAADLCLLDLDLQYGSAALLLDLEQRASIIDLIRSPDRLDGSLLRGAMVKAADGRFDLLASPPNVPAIDNIDAAAVAAAIEIASREYALTIIDLPTLWSQWTHAALRASNAIVLVAQATVPSLRQGHRQIEMLREEELDDLPLIVVVNRLVSTLLGPAGVSIKSAEAALGRKVDHFVPESPAIRAAADAGLPLSEVRGGRSPEAKIAAMFEAIVAAVGDRGQQRSAAP